MPDNAPAPKRAGAVAEPEKPSRWSRFKGALVRTEQEIILFKGLTVVSVLGTILVGYFQYLSAYEDKITTQYKEDFTASAAAFNEISKAFATVQTLQQTLYFNYREVAGSDLEKNAQSLQIKTAHEIYKEYNTAYSSLRQNIDLLARKAEMQIDWASDRKRDPGAPRDINVDPLTRAKLGAYNFDCDDPNNMPHFPRLNPQTDEERKVKSYAEVPARDEDNKIIAGKPKVHIDWYSAKHHVWTMYYCLNGTHKALEVAREWASDSQIDSKAREKFLKDPDAVESALDSQVLRLQAFMSLAMLRLDNIRVKYRPNGFLCHIPIVREVIDVITQSFTGAAYCSPIRFAQS